MRIGITVSIIAHIVLLTVGLINLGWAEPLKPVVELISVELVPIEEYSNIRAGQLGSKIVETPTPSIVESDKPAVVAQPTGNTEENQALPSPADIPTPAPVTNTAPLPEIQPKPIPEPEPVVAPVPAARPALEPVPEPTPVVESTLAPTPELAPELVATPAPTPEPTPAPTIPVVAAPAPAARPANLDQKRQRFAAAEAERKKKEEQERKRAAAVQQQTKPQLDASLADDISAIINNDKTTGGITGQGGTPALGDTKGTSARLSQSAIDGLVARIKTCWNLLPSDINSGLNVVVVVTMNPDRSVAATKILSADPSPAGGAVARAAQRAITACGPYDMLSGYAFDDWRQIEMELRP
ncbi:MAG: hypothetical protein MO846_08740 [Candidatus Devosia symbiotica]|nr:hypothetical protein [Candidatus Devosia symbiotica]